MNSQNYDSSSLPWLFTSERHVCICSISHGQWSRNCLTETNLDAIQKLLKKWRIKANESKLVHVTFTTQRETCSPVHINNVYLPQQDDIKYLGLDLDAYLQNGSNWEWCSPKCIGYLDRSQNSPQETQLSYTKQCSNQSGPMEYNFWVQLPLQTEILECFQSKVFHMTVDAPWYVPNTAIWTGLQTPTVKEEIHHYSSRCSACLIIHPNDLVVNLMVQPDNNAIAKAPAKWSDHMINSLILVFSVWFVSHSHKLQQA
jgi:hypothetical protein